jgi:tryptophan-rich sensory protein
MAGLDGFEATTLFFFLVAWWVNPFDTNGTSSKVMRKRYRNYKARLKIIPGWLFGPIWFILYTIIAVSMWLYFNYASTEKHEDHHHFYDAILALMIANYVLNKLWTMFFFTLQNYWLGAIDAVLIFLTALALEILVWFHNNGDVQGAIYASGALLIPYVIWTLYAAVLSIEIAIRNHSESFFGYQTLGRHPGEEGLDLDLPVTQEMQSFEEDARARLPSRPMRRYPATGKQTKRRPRQGGRGEPQRRELAQKARGIPMGGW